MGFGIIMLGFECYAYMLVYVILLVVFVVCYFVNSSFWVVLSAVFFLLIMKLPGLITAMLKIASKLGWRTIEGYNSIFF